MRLRFLVPLLLAAPLGAQPVTRARAQAVVDSVVAASAPGWTQAAGMTVAVTRGAETLVLKGYGKADLEFDLPTPADAVYEIGSVTKQFTAAALLQLVEQGKVALDDPVTRYLPDYPTQGRTVTVRRLLDHTSGIRGYTEIAEFGAIAPRELPRDTLVALFASKPFDFEPGAAQAYNNSAYFLLGLIIEKVTGRSYAEVVKANLFDAAGMRDSRYCSQGDVVPHRARGYQLSRAGLRRADYIDHTWPYAAGSLCSTARDLVAWTRALHDGRILRPTAYRELLTPGRLADGTPLRYAKGLFVNDSMAGHPVVHHGGDIPGFSTELAWLPEDSIAIAVLVNTAGPVRPEALTGRIVHALLGDRTPKRPAFRGRAADYAGEYRGIGRGRPQTFVIAAGDTTPLALRVNGGPPEPLVYLGGDTFGRGPGRYTFVRARAGGPVTALRADNRVVYSIAARTAPAPAAAAGGAQRQE
ncbi:serine hydrolase domain-containing protein [Roseisolibacter sp. H3M3-2]|uniref:serine hydrolase domain-containing protein n=1 Tax=Roseisolibacter sp. H3M3-2 TaxID=3031323 RepID=UPI0023DC7F3F|nr:serine hydrolase domain-containing protein [Roseisolibacter sp. H3M3-2]MDF1502361.1 serine hydrolase [Roseisolibacter sp. H3M3-2]